MTEKSYPNIYSDEFQEIKTRLAANAILSEQDSTHFQFDLKLPIGTIKGEVGYIEPVMKVYIRSKPILIPNSQIFKELDKMLSVFIRA